MLRAAGGAHVVAVDFSAEAVALATRLYRPSADFLRGDLEALPFRSGVFDLVTCFETIEHVRRPETGIREIARVLTSRGALLVSSPNGAFFPTGHSGNPFHHTEFRPDELADLLAPHFKHVLISGQRLARPTPGILNYSGAPVQHEALTPAKPTLRRWLFGRLPYLLQDLVWRVVHGESYYPREEEFVLEAEHPERFPVIIAVCQRE
jgi:SAM-dependent methyltransferase